MGLVGSYHHYIFKAKFHTKDYRATVALTLRAIHATIFRGLGEGLKYDHSSIITQRPKS